MASAKLFASTATTSKNAPTDTVNAHGVPAYAFNDKHALAQYIVSSCFNDAFYASGEEQLEAMKQLAAKVESDFLAKAAVYGHENAKMKDTPVFILASLVSRGERELVSRIFNRVITNAKMLCNFVQIMRSGQTGRKSFGTSTKTLIQNWLLSRDADRLFNDSIGHSNPSLPDIIKMVHPRAQNVNQNTMFRYLLGKEYDEETLTARIKHLEEFKRASGKFGMEKSKNMIVPQVDFRVLSNLPLTDEQWKSVALNMSWNQLRMNINTLVRHNVFDDKSVVKALASKLANADEVRKYNVFPYQLLTTFQNVDNAPMEIRNALQDALEVATENVHRLEGGTVALCDVSGSMSSPATGNRVGSTSKTRCVDVAGLISSVILRRDDVAEVVPFEYGVVDVKLNPRDSIMTNAQKLADLNRGGTNCAAALEHLNAKKAMYKNVIMVSDNQSWVDFYGRGGSRQDTPMNQQWEAYKRRVKDAKMALIDIQPYPNTQLRNSADVMNIGGFNDSVFDVISRFFAGENTDFVKVIESVNI
jgi:60 kDa SS-A/Ro ribonucleoprotein